MNLQEFILGKLISSVGLGDSGKFQFQGVELSVKIESKLARWICGERGADYSIQLLKNHTQPGVRILLISDIAAHL